MFEFELLELLLEELELELLDEFDELLFDELELELLELFELELLLEFELLFELELLLELLSLGAGPLDCGLHAAVVPTMAAAPRAAAAMRRRARWVGVMLVLL